MKKNILPLLVSVLLFSSPLFVYADTLWQSSGSDISNTNAGNIGIGTTSPTQLFSVGGNGYLTGGVGVGKANTIAGSVWTSGGVAIGASSDITDVGVNQRMAMDIQPASVGNSSSGWGINLRPTFGSDLANNAKGLEIGNKTTASPTAASIGLSILDTTITAGSVTNAFGIRISNQTAGGTGNYGIDLQVSSGAEKYNIYAQGTAKNYFAGNVGIGTTTPTAPLEVNGNIKLSGNLISDGDICLGVCQ